MTMVYGRGLITAKVLKMSRSWTTGIILTTFEIEYPRFILAEVNTHKMLGKNSASSRAIPTERMLQLIEERMAMPVHWGKNQPGMSAREELDDDTKARAMDAWRDAARDAIKHSKILADLGVHKQIVNRVTEPFGMMKTVISGTEWNNLWWLRDHDDAQPEFHELAHTMRTAYDAHLLASKHTILKPGEWHLPYVDISFSKDGAHYHVDGEEIDLATAKKVSASCCAQVSYRRLDDSIEKAVQIFDRLVTSEPVHASPAEHQGTPIEGIETPGVTHRRLDGTLWSANLQGWVQHRQLLNNHTKW